jgi:hypothetical protein
VLVIGYHHPVVFSALVNTAKAPPLNEEEKNRNENPGQSFYRRMWGMRILNSASVQAVWAVPNGFRSVYKDMDSLFTAAVSHLILHVR